MSEFYGKKLAGTHSHYRSLTSFSSLSASALNDSAVVPTALKTAHLGDNGLKLSQTC